MTDIWKMMTMADQTIQMGQSLIQHGTENDRVYLMHYHPLDGVQLADRLVKFAQEKSYSKIVAKIPESVWPHFQAAGYRLEANILHLYAPGENGCFACYYLKSDRAHADNEDRIASVLKIAKEKKEQLDNKNGKIKQNEHLQCRQLTERDASDLAGLYQKIFATYPFPIHDHQYIQQTMNEKILYYGVFEDKRLIAAASSETDPEHLNSEMTDFAVLPEHRGQQLAFHLLQTMEKEMIAKGYRILYTIARATSYGMNATFAKAGYHFGGTLVNNTQIAGQIESMNVWYRSIL